MISILTCTDVPRSFAQTVVSIGINHVVKRLAEFDQPID